MLWLMNSSVIASQTSKTEGLAKLNLFAAKVGTASRESVEKWANSTMHGEKDTTGASIMSVSSPMSLHITDRVATIFVVGVLQEKDYQQTSRSSSFTRSRWYLVPSILSGGECQTSSVACHSSDEL